jgi:hypothetical protein
VPPVRAYGQGQSVHPPRLHAVAGRAAIRWRRWSERSVTFSVPGVSWSSVASSVAVTGRGWRAAITSSTACWRAVRWSAESRSRAVLDGPPEAAMTPGRAFDPRSPVMHRPLVVRRGSPVTPAARPPADSARVGVTVAHLPRGPDSMPRLSLQRQSRRRPPARECRFAPEAAAPSCASLRLCQARPASPQRG